MSLRRAAAAAGLALAASAANAQFLYVNQSFDSLDSIPGLTASGWVFTNASSPAGSTVGWYQGEPNVFSAFAGPDYGYLAANYNNAAPGGTIANYLFTNAFPIISGGTVSFWARSDGAGDFTDQLRVGLTHGAATVGDFVQFGPTITLTNTWTQYSFTFAQGFGATGRAVIEYVGSYDTANYAGIDNLTVNVVPEPETWALMAAGLGVLGVVGRRRRKAA